MEEYVRFHKQNELFNVKESSKTFDPYGSNFFLEIFDYSRIYTVIEYLKKVFFIPASKDSTFSCEGQ